MVSTIPLVDTITPRPEPLQPTPHLNKAPDAVRLPPTAGFVPLAVREFVLSHSQLWNSQRVTGPKFKLEAMSAPCRPSLQRNLVDDIDRAKIRLEPVVLGVPAAAERRLIGRHVPGLPNTLPSTGRFLSASRPGAAKRASKLARSARRAIL